MFRVQDILEMTSERNGTRDNQDMDHSHMKVTKDTQWKDNTQSRPCAPL